MSEMIERVARAMAANDSGPEGSRLFEIHWEEFGLGYRDSAIAAIGAMREPTVEMMDAGYGMADEALSMEIPHIYRAMIDEALK